MKLSVIIPVYNEANTIVEVVNRVLAVNIDKEIIIVDDGSYDGTSELLNEIKGDNIKVIRHPKNLGKGAAISTGLKFVSGDIVIFQDADLEYNPREYSNLIAPIVNGYADIVYGSRFSHASLGKTHSFWNFLGNKFLTFVTNILYNTTLTDMETGYKVFRTDVIKKFSFKSKGFSIEPEITAKIFKAKKYRVCEIPISYFGRSYKEGKKITWRDGFEALFTLFWRRFFN